MLHPNETVVDHTKGQGMGGITIVNNIDAKFADSGYWKVDPLEDELDDLLKDYE